MDYYGRHLCATERLGLGASLTLVSNTLRQAQAVCLTEASVSLPVLGSAICT